MITKREKLQYIYVFLTDLVVLLLSTLLAWLVTDGLLKQLVPYAPSDWVQTICLLMLAFVPQFGLQGIWISIFTAISAFCNAGFDLFGQFGAYSSLVPYVHNYYVQAVVMFMIIAGGLGFMVWVELIQYPKKRKLSLHARVVLIFSVLLWVGGAALIGLLE